MEIETNNNRKNGRLKWVGLLVLILVIVAAAFAGGRMLNQRINPLDAGGGTIGGNDFQPREIHVIPAEELPGTPPDQSGTFVSRQDNSIFIGLGNDTGIFTSAGERPDAGESSEYSGAMVEIVVSADTTVYQEVLDLNSRPATAGEIQQEVTEGSIEDLGDASYIWVWGREVGDRILADVMLYTEPMVKPGSAP